MMSNRSVFLAMLIAFQLGGHSVILGQEDRFQKEIAPEKVQRLEEGRQLRRSGELNDAIERLRSLTQDQPDYYLAHYNLALAYVNKKEFGEAIESFTRALEIKQAFAIPEATIYNSIGWAYLLKGDYSRSEEYLLIGTEKENQDILSQRSKQKLFNNIGLLYMNRGDPELSEKYLRQAAEEYGSSLARKHLETLHDLGVSQEETEEAHREFHFAVVGSFRTLDEAKHFAKELMNAKLRYRPEIYLAENAYYGVTFGGYLSFDEAVNRVVYAIIERDSKRCLRLEVPGVG